MGAAVPVVVAVLNFVGSLLPQLPAFIDEVRGHPDLNDHGKAALALLDADEKAVEAVPLLPSPTPRR